MSGLLESLDYIYVPAPELEAAVRLYTEALRGTLCWRIRDGKTWVAAVRMAGGGPLILLANHLDRGQTILIYRVQSIAAVQAGLDELGWFEASPQFEIPQGPCLLLRDPGGLRIAVYERTRPWMDATFEGRFDPPQA